MQEISVTNEIVALRDDADADRIPTNEERSAVLQQLIDARSKKAPKNEKLVFEEPPLGWLHGLQQLIGESKALEVGLVAEEKQEDCLIDAPAEFRERVFAQVCIQVCYLIAAVASTQPRFHAWHRLSNSDLVLL